MTLKSRKQRKKKRKTGNSSEYWNECGKKYRYTTEEAAQNAATHAKNARGVHCRVYRCKKYCGKWHITEDDS